MVAPAAERPEFAEIPAPVREALEERIRAQAFDLLHAEAVRRGDLGAAPRTWFDRWPGWILKVLFAILFGGLVGCLAVAVTFEVIRELAAAI